MPEGICTEQIAGRAVCVSSATVHTIISTLDESTHYFKVCVQYLYTLYCRRQLPAG